MGASILLERPDFSDHAEDMKKCLRVLRDMAAQQTLCYEEVDDGERSGASMVARPQVCRLLKDCNFNEELRIMEADLAWIRENEGRICCLNTALLKREVALWKGDLVALRAAAKELSGLDRLEVLMTEFMIKSVENGSMRPLVTPQLRGKAVTAPLLPKKMPESPIRKKRSTGQLVSRSKTTPSASATPAPAPAVSLPLPPLPSTKRMHADIASRNQSERLATAQAAIDAITQDEDWFLVPEKAQMYGKLMTFKARTISLFRRLRKTSGELVTLVEDAHWYEQTGAAEQFKEYTRLIVDTIEASDAVAENEGAQRKGDRGHFGADDGEGGGGGGDACLVAISVVKPRRLRGNLQRTLFVFADRIELRVPDTAEVAESFPMSTVFGIGTATTAAHRIVLGLNKDRMELVATNGAEAKKVVVAVRERLLAAARV